MNDNAIIMLVGLLKELILSRCRTKEDANRLMVMLVDFERAAYAMQTLNESMRIKTK